MKLTSCVPPQRTFTLSLGGWTRWLQVAWALCGWMLTLPCAGLVAAALFGLIAQSPKALPPSQTHVYPLELAAPVPPLADTALQALQGASQGVCVVQTHCNPVS